MVKRINSVDILRGVAIICMIVGHLHQQWTAAPNELFGRIVTFIGLWSPPFFVLISGISCYILIYNRIQKELPLKKIYSEVLKRSIFIIAISTLFNLTFGFMLNFQATFIFGFLYWSVFQLIGFSMLTFFGIPFLRKKFRILLYICIPIIVFLLNHLIIFYKIEFLYFLMKAYGPFPFLPWANIFLLGVAIGDILLNTQQEQLRKYLYVFLFIGIANFTIWLLWAYQIKYLVIDRFIEGIGLFFILFSIFYYLADIKEYDNIIQRKVIRWGNFSFSIYYIHFGMILIMLYINYYFLPEIFSNGILIIHYLLIVSLVFFMLEVFFIIWEKLEYKYGLEWLMRKFSLISFSFKKNEIKD